MKTSAQAPWLRMASARQFASRIARCMDRKGVVMPSPILIVHPCCSLTTLKTIMTCPRGWLETRGGQHSKPHAWKARLALVHHNA